MVAKILKAAIAVLCAFFLFIIIRDNVKDLYNDYQTEYTSTKILAGEDVTVVIPEGAKDGEVAKILKQAGLIKYTSAFTRRLKNSKYEDKIVHGTYTLNTGMNTLEMMKVMAPVADDGAPIGQLVVPEGFTINQIASRCYDQGICSKQDFINAVQSVTTANFPYLADVPQGINVTYKLEGYIFPATYDIYEDTTAESLVAWMLETFENYYTEEKQERAAELGYNSYDVVRMASLIERECKVDEERNIFAAVFENRIKAGMPLEADSTVLYAVTNGYYNRAELSEADFEVDSPYNTYKNKGLPIGAICNPGLACLNAALYPDSDSYLYYAKANPKAGTHVFAETLDDLDAELEAIKDLPAEDEVREDN